MKNIVFFLFFTAIGFFGFAQINLNGKIVNGSRPIYNVTIANKTQFNGTVTDNYGDFALPVIAGDLIQFSSIGYKSVEFVIPDTISAADFRILVNLIADTVYLKEAVIVPWPQNRVMLKEAMLSNRKEKTQISAYAGFREIEGDPVEPEPKFFSNPVSFIFSKLSKKARQEKKMEKYRQMLQEDEFYEPQKP